MANKPMDVNVGVVYTKRRHQLAGDGKHTIKMMMTWGWFIGLMLR